MTTPSSVNHIDPSHFCKTPEECVQLYDNWAEKYNSDVVDIEYRAPQLLIEVVVKYVQNKNAKILDFLCGTGTVARLLKDQGYNNIDGIDGSERMLDHCRGSGIYKNVYQEILQPGIASRQLESYSYDAVIAVGVFSPGHMDAEFLDHVYELVKQNGLIIFGMRVPWVKELDMERKVKQLETDGIWRLIEKEEKSNYRQNVPGIFYILERL